METVINFFTGNSAGAHLEQCQRIASLDDPLPSPEVLAAAHSRVASSPGGKDLSADYDLLMKESHSEMQKWAFLKKDCSNDVKQHLQLLKAAAKPETGLGVIRTSRHPSAQLGPNEKMALAKKVNQCLKLQQKYASGAGAKKLEDQYSKQQCPKLVGDYDKTFAEVFKQYGVQTSSSATVVSKADTAPSSGVTEDRFDFGAIVAVEARRCKISSFL